MLLMRPMGEIHARDSSFPTRKKLLNDLIALAGRAQSWQLFLALRFIKTFRPTYIMEGNTLWTGKLLKKPGRAGLIADQNI